MTTRQAGGTWQNGASLNGGTLVRIYGQRFAAPLFSVSQTDLTSNQVIIINQYSSYNCLIHPEKTTNSLITCYT